MIGVSRRNVLVLGQMISSHMQPSAAAWLPHVVFSLGRAMLSIEQCTQLTHSSKPISPVSSPYYSPQSTLLTPHLGGFLPGIPGHQTPALLTCSNTLAPTRHGPSVSHPVLVLCFSSCFTRLVFHVPKLIVLTSVQKVL